MIQGAPAEFFLIPQGGQVGLPEPAELHRYHEKTFRASVSRADE